MRDRSLHLDAIWNHGKRIVDSFRIGWVDVRIGQDKARRPISPADNCRDGRLSRFQNALLWSETSYEQNLAAPGALRMPSAAVQAIVNDDYGRSRELQTDEKALRDSRTDRDDCGKTLIVPAYPPALKPRSMMLKVMPMVNQRD